MTNRMNWCKPASALRCPGHALLRFVPPPPNVGAAPFHFVLTAPVPILRSLLIIYPLFALLFFFGVVIRSFVLWPLELINAI